MNNIPFSIHPEHCWCMFDSFVSVETNNLENVAHVESTDHLLVPILRVQDYSRNNERRHLLLIKIKSKKISNTNYSYGSTHNPRTNKKQVASWYAVAKVQKKRLKNLTTFRIIFLTSRVYLYGCMIVRYYIFFYKSLIYCFSTD